MLILILTLVIALTLGCSANNSGGIHEFTFETMGTIASAKLDVPPGMPTAKAEALVRNSFAEVNLHLSTWNKNSEISRLNRAPADSAFTPSSILRSCLVTAQQLQRQSSGAFDPTAESLMRLWGFYRREGRLPAESELQQALADLGLWRLENGKVIKETPGTRFDLGGIANLFIKLASLAVMLDAGGQVAPIPMHIAKRGLQKCLVCPVFS